MSEIIDWVTGIVLTVCGGIEQLAVVIVSMVPLIELKGGIPIGEKFGLGLWESFGYALLGSSLVCIPLYFIYKWILRFKFFKRIEDIVRSKAKSVFIKTDKLEQSNTAQRKLTFYKWLGVFVFVAIPIPLTGVWTGTLVAVLLGLRFWYMLTAVAAGNVVAGGVILLLTWIMGEYVDYLLLGLFAIVAVLFIIFCWKVFRPRKNSASQEIKKPAEQSDKIQTE